MYLNFFPKKQCNNQMIDKSDVKDNAKLFIADHALYFGSLTKTNIPISKAEKGFFWF